MNPSDGALEARGVSDRSEKVLTASLSWMSAAVAALAFAVVALSVRRGLAGVFDVVASLSLHRLERPWLTFLMTAVSALASPLGVLALTFALAWYAFRRHDARAGALAIAQVALSATTNFVLKVVFHRPRPELFGGDGEPSTFSFPSWHAMASVAVFGTLALLLVRHFPRARGLIGGSAVLLALAVGLSRIYLGMHWPTDVLAGYLAGWILLLAFGALIERLPAPSP